MNTNNISQTLLKDMEVLEDLESRAFLSTDKGIKKLVPQLREMHSMAAEMIGVIIDADGLPLPLDFMADIAHLHLLVNEAMLLVFKSHIYV